MTRCFFGWHRWTKWERYMWQGRARRVAYGVPMEDWHDYAQSRQKRECELCGLAEERVV